MRLHYSKKHEKSFLLVNMVEIWKKNIRSIGAKCSNNIKKLTGFVSLEKR